MRLLILGLRLLKLLRLVRLIKTVETVATLTTAETTKTENLKKYDLVSDSLKAGDTSASKKEPQKIMSSYSKVENEGKAVFLVKVCLILKKKDFPGVA